jgi:pimeloyl-ACP methyl ester carboxylesterase
MESPTIVFIHGMFMTPLCWEHWTERFRSRGYTCAAPAWPGRDVPIETQRKKHPDSLLGALTLTHVVDHMTDFIRKLGPKPVLIGHSMGGLVTQILLNRDLAAAGVAIDSAPPVGVLTTRLSFLKANWPMVNPFVSGLLPRFMSFKDFQYAFVNTLPLEEQRKAYDRYVVPESRGVPRESVQAVARIDFRKPHAPLLLTAGASDNIVPAPLNKTNHRKYRHSPSVTDFKEFPGRVHFVIGQKGWEEVADYVLVWLKGKGL